MGQVYNLFRQLGLRHIFVVPRASRAIGMITRKDLLIYVSQLYKSFSHQVHFGLYGEYIHYWFFLQDTEDSAAIELHSTSVRSLSYFNHLCSH